MNKSQLLRTVLTIAVSTAIFSPAWAEANWTQTLFESMKAEATRDSKANPWTDEHGGTWSFAYGGTAAAPGTSGTWNLSGDVIGFKETYGCLAANVSDATKAGPQGGVFAPGECYLHPHSGRSYEYVRYVVPEDGVYSVSGTIRCVGGSGSDGVTVVLLVSSIAQTSVVTTNDGEPKSFSAENLKMSAGTVIDLRYDCYTTLNFDAHAFDYSISRVGDLLPANTQSACMALAAATAGEVQNPWVSPDGKPGVWTFLRRVGGTDTVLPGSWKCVKSETLRGLASDGTSYPKLLANVGSAPAGDDGAKVQPYEVFYHPENNSNKMVVRFTAVRNGRYAYHAFVRSLNPSESGNGVNAVFLGNVDGQVSVLHSQNVRAGATAVFDGQSVQLLAGDMLELQVDANGNYSYDASALDLQVSLEQEYPAVHDMTASLRSNVLGENPAVSGYVDAEGGIWSYGRYVRMSATDSFCPMDRYESSGTFRGFSGDTYSGGVNYPYLMVNETAEDGIYNGGKVTAGEIAVHPWTERCPVVRFTAPSAGLYAFEGSVRHVNPNGGDGVDGALIVKGVGRTGFAHLLAKADSGFPAQVAFSVSGLWLDVGDVIDLAADCCASYSYDATAFAGRVIRLGPLPDAAVIGFDICGTDRSVYSGPGRVGSAATSSAWSPVRRGSTVSAYPSVSGTKRLARLELSRAAGSETLSGVPAVIADGVASSGTDDPVSFAVSGLNPGSGYEILCYSRNGSGVNGVFTIGGETKTASETWFASVGGDYCAFHVTADENGVVSGVFSGGENGTATFCALQIVGSDFPAKPKLGAVIFVR